LITFTIPGAPVGKGRPRFARMGKFVKTYTDKDTLSYENLVKVAFRMIHCGNPKEGPLKISVWAYFPIPASATKKFKLAASNEDLPVTKKPDGDNIIKIILDALNQIAFKDDAQVFDVRCIKLYSANPRTVVQIEDDIQIQF
jgi:Holliday junction resolvase RusA-like endonuclease